MSSRIPSMFKTPRHRSFNYKPVFYDEQKERKAELEQLVEEHRSGKVSDERRLQQLRGKLSKRGSHGAVRQQQSSGQKLRFITIVTILAAAIWLFFNWS